MGKANEEQKGDKPGDEKPGETGEEGTKPEKTTKPEVKKPQKKAPKPPAQTGKPRGRGEKPTKVTMVNNSSRMINIGYPDGMVALKPGPNAVDRHLYEKHIRDHETVKLYSGQSIGSRKLEPGKPAIIEIDESGPPSTINRTVDEAVAFVGKVCDDALLYKLKADDPRPEVQHAIDERKVEIGPTAVKKE